MQERPTYHVVLYAALTSFLAYTCVYGIRMPIFAAQFLDYKVRGFDLKVAFTMAQTAGIAVGKLGSTILISSLERENRLSTLYFLGSGATIGLLPVYLQWIPEIQVLGLFLCGICLAPIWGIIVLYLEGRGQSEILFAAAGLSPIFAGGLARSLGAYLIQSGIPEHTLPFTCGLVSLAFFCIITFYLNKLPPPTNQDIALRNVRKPMDATSRMQTLSNLGFGVWPLLCIYSFLNSFRAYREYFAYEIWSEIWGRPTDPINLVRPEIYIGLFAISTFACMSFIHSNRAAFFSMLGFMIAGGFLIWIGNELHVLGYVSNTVWTILIGVGLWIAYVPAGSMIFERLIAMSGLEVTAVFLIYLTDGLGYLSTIVMLQVVNDLKNASPAFSHLMLFRQLSRLCACSVIFFSIITALYYHFFYGTGKPATESQIPADNSGTNKPVAKETPIEANVPFHGGSLRARQAAEPNENIAQ
eukprot:TRINITY_DN3695_c0_g1_i3.p1 TRINITY_DN3695_c0_g1~~TRINITY_DN3695_c0_g1_i3.p1  ORF type:complete len:470 (-),score=76.42 TRINITY_DN3695_c0_g1_i3:50-1459(-)